MVRMSAPFSSIWTANACRKEWGVMGLGMPQRSPAIVGLLTGFLDRMGGDRLVHTLARKQPVLRSSGTPPLA